MARELRNFFDDTAIADRDVLYRAVAPSLIDNWDSLSGSNDDIPSNAWQDQREEVAAERWFLRPCASVAVARILRAHDRDIDFWLELLAPSSYRLYGVIETTAEEVRQAISLKGEKVPQGVMLFPTESDPWHAVIWSKRGTKRTKAEMKALTRTSRWVRLPTRPA